MDFNSDSDGRVRFEIGERVGLAVLALLDGVVERAEIAGSVRRRKPLVHDVEVVIQPKGSAWGARLDKLVETGRISKALYGQPGKYTTRWGDKYRGFVLDGMRVEVFCADAVNWGYIYWLRTGPGDANHYAMMRLAGGRVTASEGYMSVDGRRVMVADEAMMFHLLGMTPEPRKIWQAYERSEGLYKVEIGRYGLQMDALVWAEVEAKPEQKGMF